MEHAMSRSGWHKTEALCESSGIYQVLVRSTIEARMRFTCTAWVPMTCLSSPAHNLLAK